MGLGHKPGARYKQMVKLGETPDDCWEWQGSVNKRTGYGKKQWHGKTWLAHRWMWMVLFGDPPKDMTINHKCSNRSCVNPHHLELATHTENVHHGKATKLTDSDVKTIRSMAPYDSYEKAAMCKWFNISLSHLNAVLRGASRVA